jgi:hypothetical protein
MAGESRYVTGLAGVDGSHVVRYQFGLVARMRARAVCGETTMTVAIFGCHLETWLPAYGGCVNCLKALGAKQ